MTAFKNRSYTPIPFLAVALLFAHPTLLGLVIGGCCMMVGQLLRLWGVSFLGRASRTTRMPGGSTLVTTGPFACVRNPVYVANVIIYAGVGIMSMAFFPWLLVSSLIWFPIQYRLIVDVEEEYLASRFGEVYETYRSHVSRFVPRFGCLFSQWPISGPTTLTSLLRVEKRTLQAEFLVIFLFVGVYVLTV
jgi:protein-S-isoprenylcysteine O-methyltransferase Ste14